MHSHLAGRVALVLTWTNQYTVLLVPLYSPSCILAAGVNSLTSSWIFYLLYHSDIHFHFVTKVGIVLVTYALVCFLFLGINALVCVSCL